MKNRYSDKVEEIFLVSGFFLLILLVFSQFVFRYIFDFSVSWTQEASRYLLIWIAWICVPYAIKDNRHIRVELIKNIIPSKYNKFIELIVFLSWVAFAFFLTFIGAIFVLNNKTIGQGSPMMAMPMWIVYLILPLTGILIFWRASQKFIALLKEKQFQEEN